ncbi:hypothetical protein ACUN8C_05810 [Kushneria sp. Sum13]|uniref:hypothetical protein n=1 Tax=Kushneria sp. Sum13 TaxID=3459196 RepID=UPI00404638E4
MSDMERLYCDSCMSTWVGPRSGDCPSCGMKSFFLIRGGSFGAAYYFKDSGKSPADFAEIKSQEVAK